MLDHFLGYGDDAVPREIETILNYMPASSSSSSSSSSGCVPSVDINITTRKTYTPDGDIGSVTAVNSRTGDQTTQFIYGTTLVDSDIATSKLKRKEVYPDSFADDHVVAFGYNRQLAVKQLTDQMGTTRQFALDLLGRLTLDRASTFGTGVDGTVRRVERAFDRQGNPYLLTNYDAATGGSVVNQIKREFNGLGQLIKEWREQAVLATNCSIFNSLY